MRLFLIVTFLLVSKYYCSQNYSRSDFKELYIQTIHTLKNKDTLGFIDLWVPNDSLLPGCNSWLFINEDLKRHFTEIHTLWMPYLDQLNYADVFTEEQDKDYTAEYGQAFCYLVRQGTTRKQIHLCTWAIYYKGKLKYVLGARLPLTLTD